MHVNLFSHIRIYIYVCVCVCVGCLLLDQDTGVQFQIVSAF